MSLSNRFQIIRTTALAMVLAGVSHQAAHATIIFDQGPLTGSAAGSWDNQTAGQNFADQVTFGVNYTVDGLNYFTNFDLSGQTGGSDFHLKILANTGSQPGALLYSQDLGYTSDYTEGGVNAYHFDFASQLFLANVTYWVGISGNGFEAAQLSLTGVSGGDERMAQFAGSSYSFLTAVGDQAFQLTGALAPNIPPPRVPDTASTALLAGMGLVSLFGLRRRLGRSA